MNNVNKWISAEQCMKEYDDAGCTSDALPHPRKTFETCVERDSGLSRHELDILLNAFSSGKKGR